jgi:predicted lipoprotein with Yx(FWY)xxD motif
MKRSIVLLAGVLALGFASLALAASGPAKVKLRKTGLGKVLAAGSGFTLYTFTKDSRNSDKCVKIKNCAGIWPPLMTHGKPLAGPGVNASLLGKIRLPHGKSQVTYAGHPVYTYSGDSGPGQTLYVGTPQFGGTWYAISAAGKTIK